MYIEDFITNMNQEDRFVEIMKNRDGTIYCCIGKIFTQ